MPAELLELSGQNRRGAEEKVRKWFETKIKGLEQPKSVIACYNKTVEAMEQAIQAGERQLAKQ